MADTYEVKQSSGLVVRDDRRLSVKEAAARAGVSTTTVRRKIVAGDLAGYRVRGTNRIVLLEADVDEVFALERVEPRVHHAVTPAPPKRSRRPPSRGTRDALRAIEEEPKVAKHTYRWWDGDVYRQATFTTKADKADFVTEVRHRRRLGLSLSFEPEEHDPRLDEFIEDYSRLHAIPTSGTPRAAATSRSGSSGSCRGWAPTGCGSCPRG